MGIVPRFLVCVICCIITAGAAVVRAEDTAPAYTNKDIEKYRNPSDERPAGKETTAVPAYERKKETKRAGDRKEQEFWCSKASAQKRKIEKAQSRVKGIEEDIEQEKRKGDGKSAKEALLFKRLKKSKTEVVLEEKNLNDLENRAHRQGIPPGWLRCQFD